MRLLFVFKTPLIPQTKLAKKAKPTILFDVQNFKNIIRMPHMSSKQ